MSLIGKNKALFSYNNSDRAESRFMYKDFEKTKSYHSTFVRAKFIGSSMRAAHIKYCDFSDCTFQDMDFVGTNFRGSNFSGAHFKDCIFVTTILDKANFSNVSFENCYFVGTGITKAKNFPDRTDGLIVLPSQPAQEKISTELRTTIEALRENNVIRRSNTLHGKKGRINTLTVMILMNEYTEQELIRYLPKLPQYITTQFYTISYLKLLLKKIAKSFTI